jgi:beta-aspartyl-peptidase (threonine type)
VADGSATESPRIADNDGTEKSVPEADPVTNEGAADRACIAMAVHGGAFNIPAEEREAHRRGCRAALDRGLAVLRGGGSAIDAVEAAVNVLENDGTFDAGRGSFLDEDGNVSVDAGIMDGATLNTGSVAAAIGVPNAVTLARAVLESPHAVIVGDGARRFAERHGVAVCDPAELVHPRERARWLAAGGGLAKPDWAAQMFGDTVGAVARDASGRIAAATSTGGSPGKPKGRVGDSPFVGAGLFADDAAGASSTTGHGELIIPLVWAKDAVDLMRDGLPAPKAATEAVARLDRLEARGGIILLDTEGRVGVAWNTPAMAYALWPAGATEATEGPTE